MKHIDLDKVTMMDLNNIIRCDECKGCRVIVSNYTWTSTGKRLLEKCSYCNGIGWVWK